MLHGLVLLVKFAGIRLGLTFDSLHLAAELLLFEGHTFAFKLDLLEFLAILFAKGCELLLAFLELKSLLLVFLVDCDKAFQVSLHLAKFGCKLPLSFFGCLVFIFGHSGLQFLVLVRFNEKAQLSLERGQLIGLPELQLVSQVLVELVLALQKLKLLLRFSVVG